MIAMGGNSISPKSGTGRIEEQFERTREAFDGISHFIKRGYNLCINHGNGPQVGNEIMRMELTQDTIPPLPLGVCVASTQGSIGYMIQQCLQNKLREMEIDREVVTLVSQVIVDKNDDSFKEPTRGTMISGLTFIPSFFNKIADLIIAVVCIFVISGNVIPSLQPLCPSIGFASLNSVILLLISFTDNFMIHF